MRPAEMVPVFRLSFPDPTVHRYDRLKTRTRDSEGTTELARVTDCRRATIDYVVREYPQEGQKYGKVVWRSEIADWMQYRHAAAIRAHHCRICFPEIVVCRCRRCTRERLL